MQAKRKLPLGVSNFEMLRDKDLVYIDKTKYIELLEQEYNHILFFTRPRKFGKSLFLNMLGHYYDINKKDRFEHLFGNLYIGKNPTANRNKFLVLKFNFSGLDTSDKEQFLKSFSEKINIDVQYFLKEYMEQFPQIKDAYDKIKNDFSTSVGGAVGLAIQAAKDIKTKLYVVIDEYDHFANDLMAGSKYRDNNFYNNVIRANSVVRDFYETLKIGVETSIERIILTGVTPIMLDDVTSGFNISHNISLDERYNEILGFTEDDLEHIITETNLSRDLINIDLKLFYNGYKFHTLGRHRVYNPSMMMYYFGELLMKNRTPDTFIDENLRMDYGRLKGLLSSEQSKNQLLEIAEKGCITSNIVRSFSAEKVQSPQNLISLLFYMGLLTIDKPAGVEMILKIPNYSIKTTYWEYIERIAEDEYPDLITDLSKHTEAINQLAYYSNPKPFIDYFCKTYIKTLSNRDLQNFDEKYVKVLLLGALKVSNGYIPLSEMEVSEGYTDIYLMRDPRHKDTLNEWVIEMKYIKKGDAGNTELIKKKKNEAIAQLNKYQSSYLFKDRSDIKYLYIVFTGKDNVVWGEIIPNKLCNH